MRIALALAACFAAATFAGCLIRDPHDDYDPYYGGGWGSGAGGGGGPITDGCQVDTDCGGGSGQICTRTRECLPPSQVRAVHTLWTVGGDPASATTCASVPDLSITFTSSAGEEFGYTPVPCRAGKHTIDKFPARYTHVQLTRAYDYGGGDFGTFDFDGNAQLDLPY
jgi:hypothetical protein